MPLTANTDRYSKHDDRKAIGFWVTGGAAGPHIRIFVTYEALWQIDQRKLRDDPYHAAETFEQDRVRIGEIAITQYHARGADDEDGYEGGPTLTLRADNLLPSTSAREEVQAAH